MNERLRNLPDGAGSEKSGEVVWFSMCSRYGSLFLRRKDFGEIYWPFALHGCDDDWNITHLPTGRAVTPVKDRAAGLRAIQELLALPVDWEFTRIHSKKYRALATIAGPLVRAYRNLVETTE